MYALHFCNRMDKEEDGEADGTEEEIESRERRARERMKADAEGLKAP